MKLLGGQVPLQQKGLIPYLPSNFWVEISIVIAKDYKSINITFLKHYKNDKSKIFDTTPAVLILMTIIKLFETHMFDLFI